VTGGGLISGNRLRARVGSASVGTSRVYRELCVPGCTHLYPVSGAVAIKLARYIHCFVTVVANSQTILMFFYLFTKCAR
jgi:hypothetical protein